MERPHLRPIQNRLLAVEVAGMAMFSPSAWAGGAVGLGTGAIVGANVGAPATGAVIGGLIGTGVGYTVGKSLRNSEKHRGSFLI
jgi:outer membrane protein with glycine zipper